jgi:hypothetical protein
MMIIEALFGQRQAFTNIGTAPGPAHLRAIA